MSANHLSNDDFFVRLAALFDERRKADHGSIFLTQKRSTYSKQQQQQHRLLSTYDQPTNQAIAVVYGSNTQAEAGESSPSSPTHPFPDLNPARPQPIIIRASNGKSKAKRDQKIKLSTIVEADALEAFFARYAEICKLGMTGLKKRDRSKAKERLRAKKKKQGVAGAASSEVKKA